MKEDPKHIRICEFNYPLPDERIAKFPLPVRDQAIAVSPRRSYRRHIHFAARLSAGKQPDDFQ